MYGCFADSLLTFGGVTKAKTILKVNNQGTDMYFEFTDVSFVTRPRRAGMQLHQLGHKRVPEEGTRCD
jgi:hypothetical protein